MKFIFSPRHFANLVEYFDDNGHALELWSPKEALYNLNGIPKKRLAVKIKELHKDPIALAWKRYEFLLTVLPLCGTIKVKHIKLKTPTNKYNIFPLICFEPDKVLQQDWDNFNKKWLYE